MPKRANVLKYEDPNFGQFVDFYKFLQIGRITRVDNEKQAVDIQFQTNINQFTNIPLTNPFSTGRAFIGGMPEVGSYVICGFIKLTNKIGSPVIVSYLDPLYYHALNYIYEGGKSEGTDSISSIFDKIGYGIRRLKRRKIYPGDLDFESTQGSELLLDDGIILTDSKLNEIRFSAAERTIYTNSINNFLYTNAARILNGLISRPNSPHITPITMDNGQLLYIATANGKTIDTGGQALTEVRTEIREIANAVLDVVESYDDDDFADSTSQGRLLINQVLGTLVGNEKDRADRYGKILRPQIFTNTESNLISIDDMICTPDQYLTLATAYQLLFRSGTKFDIDKEGHTFVHLAASSVAHPLGAGRSLEFAADGSMKFVIGKSNLGNRSLELDTTGKVSMNFGFDTDTMSSCDWTLDRKLSITVKAPDANGYAKQEEYFGHVYETVHGNKTIDVDGELNIIVKGKIQEDIQGAKVENYVNDKMTNYGGNHQEIITKQKQSKLGEGAVTDIASQGDTLNIIEGDKTENLTLGSKSVTLVAGDSKETLLLGSHSVDLTVGDMSESLLKGDRKAAITLGNHSIDVSSGNITENVSLGDSKETVGSGDKTIIINMGNFQIKVTAGDITIQTTAGNVNVQAASQKVTINGMLSVDVMSATTVNVKAPMVNLGSSPAQGGVVTGSPGVPSHLDFLVGLPLLSSATVKSSI